MPALKNGSELPTNHQPPDIRDGIDHSKPWLHRRASNLVAPLPSYLIEETPSPEPTSAFLEVQPKLVQQVEALTSNLEATLEKIKRAKSK